MLPGCGCCECTECCDGNYPSEFDVQISGVDEECTNCNEYVNGTYTLAKVSPSSAQCFWEYDDPPVRVTGQPCRDWVGVMACSGDPYEDRSFAGRKVRLYIYCIDENTIRAEVHVFIHQRIQGNVYVECDEGYLLTQRWIYWEDFDRWTFDCTALASEELGVKGNDGDLDIGCTPGASVFVTSA